MSVGKKEKQKVRQRKAKKTQGKSTHVYEIYMQISIDSGDMGDKRPSLFMEIARAVPLHPTSYAAYSLPALLFPAEKAANKARAQHACNYLKGKSVGAEQQIEAWLTCLPLATTWVGLSHQFELKTKPFSMIEG